MIEWKSSLSMTLARWVSAVFTLIPRKPATSLLLLPSARSCRISRSRGVKRFREDWLKAEQSLYFFLRRKPFYGEQRMRV